MPVQTSDRDRVRTIALDRPETLNAFDATLLADLDAALHAAVDDDGVAVIVLTGNGRGFSSGADMGELGGRSAHPATTMANFDRLRHTLSTLAKPVVMAVNGVAVGFGMTILGYADLVFMSTQARCRCPFTEYGLATEAASSYLFPRLLGRQNAAWILLSSEWISAQEALEIGLAWRLCEPDDLMATVHDHAARIARHPIASLSAVKRSMAAPLQDQIEVAHRREMAEFAALGRPRT